MKYNIIYSVRKGGLKVINKAQWISVKVDKEAHDILVKWSEATDIRIRRLVSQAIKDSIWWREKHGGEIIIKKVDENGIS